MTTTSGRRRMGGERWLWAMTMLLVVAGPACSDEEGEGGTGAAGATGGGGGEGGTPGTGGMPSAGGGGSGGVAVGTIVCMIKEEMPTSTGCLWSRGECDDGHVYRLECMAEMCSCTLDATIVSTFSGMSTCDLEGVAEVEYVNENCGWDLAF